MLGPELGAPPSWWVSGSRWDPLPMGRLSQGPVVLRQSRKEKDR